MNERICHHVEEFFVGFSKGILWNSGNKYQENFSTLTHEKDSPENAPFISDNPKIPFASNRQKNGTMH